jgi:hypothetical protein
MSIAELVVVVLGLAMFEIISSVDNAIINAHVLKTIPEKYRKFFLVWGMLFAVVAVRGILPFLIVWVANPELSFLQAVSFIFHPNAAISDAVAKSQGLLLLGGGVYLVMVFWGWLFTEEKKYAFLVEEFVHKQSVWFYAAASIFFTAIVYFSLQHEPALSLAAAIGSTAFFVTDGFKKNAEQKEKELLQPHISAISKLLYLELLDATFSVDGVIGAFAFTIYIPLIFIGNGIGAFVVRQMTVSGADIISRFAYLKNGAMYSIGILGSLMVFEAFGNYVPFWLAPLNTFVLLAIFMALSLREVEDAEAVKK